MPDALHASNPAQDHFHPEASRKAFATLQARAALAGWAVDLTTENGAEVYAVTRWGRTHTFDKLRDVETLVDRLTPWELRPAEGA